ncbi:MAG: DNA methylase [Chloroflexi bacterium]|nr:MAG: DNA methylase [Chloroflexota bacterium]
MISGYPSDIYDDILTGWHKDAIQTTTRGGSRATEVIWMHYDPPNHLHDYRWLGDNYRERERIKKLKRRWVRRWREMDRLQRQAILAAIQEANTTQAHR